MNRANNERFIIILASLAGIGLSLESTFLGWEFWVPPLILIGTVSLWVMHITNKPDIETRKVEYLVFTMLCAFYHGVHRSSFYDVAIVFALTMVVFSFMDKIYMMNLLFAEFFILIIIQLFLSKSGGITLSKLSISRLVLHILVECMVYVACVKVISTRNLMFESEAEKERKMEAVDSDMEDFLSNISHELRTPVNVVNGMSEMLIKRNAGDEAYSIKDAGTKLAYQIEDIQDYTECKRNKVALDEYEYMSISLINDVVMGFRLLDNDRNLDLVVDMDPKVPNKMLGDVKKLHKIFRHLLENAVKFTKKGGIFVRMYSESTSYGVNLCIEVSDTGIGMDNKTISGISEGMYQANKKRNRSTGGIGLGLFIVYGFAHKMGGFVKIESGRFQGTTVRVTIPQKVIDRTPCLGIEPGFSGDIIFHARPDKYKVPRVRDFYRSMATNLAAGIKVPLYSADTIKDIENLRKKLNVSIIFMGQEEYEENAAYFDELCKDGIVVSVSAMPGFTPTPGSGVVVMPKPLYAYPCIRIINEGKNAGEHLMEEKGKKPSFKGVKALIVDDEPMNLVVATSLFGEYEMETDTAGSGMEAIAKFREGDYDVIFMDHMMPEMDGVEAMKLIKAAAAEMNRDILVIALTANAVSGAKEMFIAEGFDGFIAKPINIADFERVMLRELKKFAGGRGL